MGDPGEVLHAYRRRRTPRSAVCRSPPARHWSRSHTYPAIGTKTSSTTRSPSMSGETPNKHLAFGYGVHFCIRAALARMEWVNAFFSELIPRLESIELAGEPEFMKTTFVGRLKHLPIRYSLR